MEKFERTKTWGRTLGQRKNDTFEAERSLLRNAFFQMREKIKLLAGEISRDLPAFTLHDITHLDALWEYCDLISGDQFPLNPAEGFLLGASFLLHDAGLTLSAYPGGLEELKQLDLWRDTRAARLARLEKAPAAEVVARVEHETTLDVLRLLHAERTTWLANQPWSAKDGSQTHLIDSSEIRTSFGQSIGEVAKSHWMDVQEVLESLNRFIGAPSFLPPDWSCDLLKIACLLRACDAAHIDARRAPDFLRTLRKPVGDSDSHWLFQSLLTRPVLMGDRLQFSASRPLRESEAASWWLCYETLRMIDSELRRTDGVLADSRQGVRLQAKGVSNTESPSLFVRCVGAADWVPVDASVKISDIPKIVTSLGGAELYGDDPAIAVRELVQNACDAIVARRVLEGRPANWGRVDVSLEMEGDAVSLLVSDNGIGMSMQTITDKLLDFGSSYWESELSRRELPGLAARDFRSTGKFGIGFYAAFMLGDVVVVTTRRPNSSADKTLKLTFGSGVEQRPIVKFCGKGDAKLDPGTSVKITLNERVAKKFTEQRKYSSDFVTRCVRMFPSKDVDICVCHGGRSETIKADSWKDCSAEEIVRRTNFEYILHGEEKDNFERINERAQRNCRDILGPSGELLGRGFLDPSANFYSSRAAGVITVGGLAALPISGLAGIFVGETNRFARDDAKFAAPFENYVPWLEDQVDMLRSEMRPEELSRLVDILIDIGYDDFDLPFIRAKSGYLSPPEVISRCIKSGVYSELSFSEFQDWDPSNSAASQSLAEIQLLDDIYVVGHGIGSVFSYGRRRGATNPWGREWRFADQSTWLIRRVIKAWGFSEQLLEELQQDQSRIQIGTLDGRPMYSEVHILRREELERLAQGS